jgi:hypothetical protein
VPGTQRVKKRGVPWGLLVVLGLYAVLVTGYVWATWWNSPGYQAAKRYHAALALLGVDDGRTCSEHDLERALEQVLEAARLLPEEHRLAEHVERLRWRYEERHLKLPLDLARHAEAVSASARQVERAREGWLPISSRERGWAVDQLLAGPRQVGLWALPGAVLILIGWAYLRFGERAVRARDHEAHLRGIEREVAEMGVARRPAPPTQVVPPKRIRPSLKKRPPAS